MPVQDGLESIIEKVGTKFRIGAEESWFVSDPTDQPYFLKAKLQHSTIVSGAGDIIETDDKRYLVLSMIPEKFENIIVQYRAILLTCNASFKVQRRTEVEVDYKVEIQWVDIVADGYGGQLDQVGKMLADTSIGDLLLESGTVYVSGTYDVKVDDRLLMNNGEKYKVESAKGYQFPGVLILSIGEDTR